jgi:hypothetical protein
LTLAAGKTLTANNTLTLAGTDATTQTFPTTSATVARTDAAQTFTGDQTLSANLIQGTAAKGFNFTANTPAAGMTSQLFNWYEEGSYTPTAGGFTEVPGAGTITYSGSYTRVGRLVKVTCLITCTGGATVAAPGSATAYLTMPITPTIKDAGTWANTTSAATNGAILVSTNGNMYIINGWSAADATWTLQATFIV